jgi:hypothetical protein
MFNWFTTSRIRNVLTFIWTGLMVICLFLGKIDFSIFAVLMLILMELESINGKFNSEP